MLTNINIVKGFIQEANRRLAHPMGFHIQSDGTNITIEDHTHEPDTLRIEIDEDYAEQINELLLSGSLQRCKTLGYVVQPVKSTDTTNFKQPKSIEDIEFSAKDEEYYENEII